LRIIKMNMKCFFKAIIYRFEVQPMKNTKASTIILTFYLNFLPFLFVTKNNIDHFLMTFHKRVWKWKYLILAICLWLSYGQLGLTFSIWWINQPNIHHNFFFSTITTFITKFKSMIYLKQKFLKHNSSKARNI
jgi:hypothetical protein